jgi:hypothetical protein
VIPIHLILTMRVIKMYMKKKKYIYIYIYISTETSEGASPIGFGVSTSRTY